MVEKENKIKSGMMFSKNNCVLFVNKYPKKTKKNNKTNSPMTVGIFFLSKQNDRKQLFKIPVKSDFRIKRKGGEKKTGERRGREKQQKMR